MASLQIPEVIPIFPLPGTVLLPSEVLPLHVFEPRYRQMVRDSLDGNRVIGITQLEPGYENTYYERPDVHPIGCAGVIAQHQSLPDGRYLIVLVGAQRFRIDREMDVPTLYRQVRVDHCPMQASPQERQGVLELRQSLIEELPIMLARMRGESVNHQDLVRLDDNQLVAIASQILQLDPGEKQQMLEAETIIDRYITLHESLNTARMAFGFAGADVDPSTLN